MKRLSLKALLSLVALLASGVVAFAYYTTPGEGSAAPGGKTGTLTAASLQQPSPSGGSVPLSWTAAALPTNDSLQSNIRYTVERSLDGGSWAAAAAACTGIAATGCTDTVTAAGSYAYRVVARFRTWTATSNERTVSVTLGPTDTTAPTVTSIVRAGGSPTNDASVDFTVTFSEDVTGVDAGDFNVVTTGGISGASVTPPISGSGSAYTVTVSTGSGSGTVGLNVDDDDSIEDAASNALSGTSGANGDFTGETYTVDKTAPTVTITRDGATPTNAAAVSWTVKFSESVTGLTQAHFELSQLNGLSGASITSLTGSGDTYTLTASTGTGSGFMNVALIDNDDTVVDAAGNPLATNAVSQGYTIDRTNPAVSSIARSSASARTNATSVSWTVTFTESVTGVDATDFALASSGLTGSPAISGVTGGGTTYTVTAGTGAGDGTLRLNLVDDDSVVDAATNPLGGTGAGNGNFTGEQYNVDRTKPSVTNIQSFESNGTTTGDGIFEANDYLKVTFNEDMTGVAATGVTVTIDRQANTTTTLSIEGITISSSTGSTGYFQQSGSRNRTSDNGSITLESSGGLTNNVVVVRIGSTVTGATAAAGQGQLALVFDGGIADGAGNVPNDASTATTFRLF
jgi:hypothetical protein